MLVCVMCGMLIPFAFLHYLDYISMTWRVGAQLNAFHHKSKKNATTYMIPASGFVAPPPPPPNGLGPPRRRERSSRLVCVEASQHALHVYIHTHRLYIHTYILTDKYIHTPIHACTYRHAPPTHRGGGAYYTYTHTYLHTNTYIHPYMHVHTDTPPQPTGGAGGRPLVPPTYKNLCTQTLWGGVGGGACRPGPYIYI